MKEKESESEIGMTIIPAIYLNLVNAEMLKQIWSGEINLTKLEEKLEKHPKAQEIYEWTLKIRKRTRKREWSFEEFIADASMSIYQWVKGGKK